MDFTAVLRGRFSSAGTTPCSGEGQVQERFALTIHRRSLERALARRKKNRDTKLEVVDSRRCGGSVRSAMIPPHRSGESDGGSRRPHRLASPGHAGLGQRLKAGASFFPFAHSRRQIAASFRGLEGAGSCHGRSNYSSERMAPMPELKVTNAHLERDAYLYTFVSRRLARCWRTRKARSASTRCVSGLWRSVGRSSIFM
jgi:hypothetical protein